jgi:16S rRNA (adenine1518-N6/adenine1519-N6)-dimethyltransferase
VAGRPLGQHFLLDPNLLDRIAVACGDKPDLVIEIGPGPGGLTASLLERARRVVAIEVDANLAQQLRQRFEAEPRLSIVESDVLATDLSQWGPAVIAGNLPYYITSPILEKVIALGPFLERGVFLVQKEVAERLAAKPGSRDYGYLSVTAQISCSVEMQFTVRPGAFRPPPKVDSAVVRLMPRTEALVVDVRRFLGFASVCFRHKRKTLRNNLASLYGRDWIDAQPEVSLRAEQLPIAGLISLFERLPAPRSG